MPKVWDDDITVLGPSAPPSGATGVSVVGRSDRPADASGDRLPLLPGGSVEHPPAPDEARFDARVVDVAASELVGHVASPEPNFVMPDRAAPSSRSAVVVTAPSVSQEESLEDVSDEDRKTISIMRAAGMSEAHIRAVLSRQGQTQERLKSILIPQQYGLIGPERVAQMLAAQDADLALRPAAERLDDKGLPANYFAPYKVAGLDGVSLLESIEAIRSELQINAAVSAGDPVPIRAEKRSRVWHVWMLISDFAQKNRAMNLFPGAHLDYLYASEQTIDKVLRRFFSSSRSDLRRAYDGVKRVRENDPEAGQAIVRFVLSAMRHAAHRGASDMAFTPMADGESGVLRLKVDGVGELEMFLDQDVWPRVIRYLINKVKGGADALKDGPLDDAFGFDDGPASQDFDDLRSRYTFRMSIIRSGGRGADTRTQCVMRLLDSQSESSDVRQLGFDSVTMKKLIEVTGRKHGVFLVTGPTGSGKTTTLYSLLGEIDPVRSWMVTAENPIENNRGLWMQNQTPGHDEAEGAYKLLRGFLRSAPDVVLFGEIRKGDIANELLDAAQTGHLVFSTLHVNDASIAIGRLKSFGVDMNILASVLLGVLAQRLVQTLCDNCKEPDESAQTTADLMAIDWLKAESINNKMTPYKAHKGGCPSCNFSGYRGRAMVYELLMVTPEVADAIERGDAPRRIARLAIKPDQTLMAQAVRLVARGMTTLDKVRGLGELDFRSEA